MSELSGPPDPPPPPPPPPPDQPAPPEPVEPAEDPEQAQSPAETDATESQDLIDNLDPPETDAVSPANEPKVGPSDLEPGNAEPGDLDPRGADEPDRHAEISEPDPREAETTDPEVGALEPGHDAQADQREPTDQFDPEPTPTETDAGQDPDLFDHLDSGDETTESETPEPTEPDPTDPEPTEPKPGEPEPDAQADATQHSDLMDKSDPTGANATTPEHDDAPREPDAAEAESIEPDDPAIEREVEEANPEHEVEPVESDLGDPSDQLVGPEREEAGDLGDVADDRAGITPRNASAADAVDGDAPSERPDVPTDGAASEDVNAADGTRGYDLVGELGDVSGAGGPWNTIDERPGGAVAQTDRLSCTSACGEMLSGRPQAEFIEKLGLPAPQGNLAKELGSDWRALLVDPENSQRAAKGLSETGPWAADLWNADNKIHHTVVVDGVDAEGLVSIRDPWDGGSTYKMAWDEFDRVWSGVAVAHVPERGSR